MDKRLIQTYAENAQEELDKLIKHAQNQDGVDITWKQFNYLRTKMEYIADEIASDIRRSGRKAYLHTARTARDELNSAVKDVNAWIEHGTQYFIPEGVCKICLHYPNNKEHGESHDEE